MAHLLIVEDEPVNAEVAQVICEAAGHTVRLAAHGREALAYLEAEAFDLLLVDVRMPVMDGIAFTRAVRANPRTATLPIIGLTARASNADQDEMREVGMDAILLKPYKNRALRDAIATVLDQCSVTITREPLARWSEQPR